MRSKLERALYKLNSMERVAKQAGCARIEPRAKLGVTLLYLFFLLSLPLSDFSTLLLFGVYPVLSCAMVGIRYGLVFKHSLLVLPFVLFIAVFNPIFDRQVVFYVGHIGITSGWICFLSVIVRGLFSVQAVFILILTTGFYNLCRGMQRMGIPVLFTTQILFVYRYIFVLLQEALCMQRAIAARSFGQKIYPVRLWGVFIGQLLVRTIARSERIHRAMLARGFTGYMKGNYHFLWKRKDTFYLLGWMFFFLVLRIYRSGCFFDALFTA